MNICIRKNTLLLFVAFVVSLSSVYAQSAAEMAGVYTDLAYFNTPMAQGLKKGFKPADINKIKNPAMQDAARAMLAKTYDTKFRYAVYNAVLSPTTLGQRLSIGDGYSKYEGITGMYLPVGKHIVLVDGITGNTDIGLLVPDWNRHAPEGIKPDKDPAGWGIHRQEFKLHNGVNIINVKDHDGLAYVDYYSEEPEKQQPVQVHFLTGKVNGYFDITKHNDTDWDRLIDNAVYPVIDARGRYVQIAYPAADCKKFAYGRGVELINNYDSMIHRQHRIMGLIKYNKVPANRILARVNYNYYMFRDGDGVAYMGTTPGNAMPLVVDPARVIKGDPCWGFSHEVGHVHQLRPFFNWGGLGEVSNNVFAIYGTTSFGNKSRLAEQKTYQYARDSIIATQKCYLTDKNPFARLVPFWQLQLYFTGAGNNPDFYPDLFEAFRKQAAAEKPAGRGARRGNGWGDRGNNNPAQYQLNFVKTACETGKTDLTDFFDKYGFFYIGECTIGDYGNYEYKMTKEMVDACRKEISDMHLPKPKTDLTLLED